MVNKKARHNLCFADFSQKPDYEQGKGRVYNFSDLPHLNALRSKLTEITGVNGLVCEGNYYYDTSKTYIQFHGDKERKVTIGARLGDSFNLYFQWYYQSKKVGNLATFELEDGDMYFMSEKALGNDWKTRNKYTVRHAASKDPRLVVK